MNYTSNNEKPFKKGKMSDVVKPKKRLFRRLSNSDKSASTYALQSDLVQILADLGIVIQNVHTISRKLINRGWVKTKQIEEEDTK